MSDILKIIVDAELSKSNNLEQQLEAIIEKYKKNGITIDAKIKDGGVKGLDDKAVKKFEKTIEALQGKVKELESQIGKGLAGGIKKGETEAKDLGVALENVLKTMQKIDHLKERVTTKNTTGSDLKKTTTTVTKDKDGKILKDETETVNNYQKINKIYDQMIEKLKTMKGLTAEQRQEMTKNLQLFKEGQHLTNLKDNKTGKVLKDRDSNAIKMPEGVEFGSEQFHKVNQKLIADYKKLEQGEKAYESAIKKRDQALKRLESIKNDKNSVYKPKDIKAIEQTINGGGKTKAGITDLKTVDGVASRYQKINQLMDELVTKSKQINDQAKMESKQLENQLKHEKEKAKESNRIMNEEAKSWGKYLEQRPSGKDGDLSKIKNRISEAEKESKEDLKIHNQNVKDKLQQDVDYAKMTKKQLETKIKEEKEKAKAVNETLADNYKQQLKQDSDYAKMNKKQLQDKLKEAKAEASEVNRLQKAQWDAQEKRRKETAKAEKQLRDNKIARAKEEASIVNKNHNSQAKIVQDAIDKQLKAEKKHEDYKVKYEEKQEKKTSDNLEKQAKDIKNNREKQLKDDEKLIEKQGQDELKMKQKNLRNQLNAEKENAKQVNQEINAKAKEAQANINRVAKNTNTKGQAEHFFNKRLDEIKNSGAVHASKEGYIRPEELKAVEQMFKAIDVNAEDLTFQLRKANQELRDMEKKKTGIVRTTYADGQSQRQKEMNTTITRNQHMANADYMVKRGIVPPEAIKEFKILAGAIDHTVDKLDLADVNAEWKKLINLERDLKKEMGDTEKVEKKKEQALNDLVKTTEKWGAKLESIDNKASRNLSPENYSKMSTQIEEVTRELNRLQNKQEEVSDAEALGVRRSITAIEQEIQKLRDLEREQEKVLAQEQRVGRNQQKQGSQLPQDVSSKFNFEAIRSDNSVLQNQRAVQEESLRTVRALHAMDEQFGRIDEDAVRVRRSVDALGNEIFHVNYTVDRGNRNFQDYSMTVDATGRRISHLGENMRQTRREMSTFEQLSQALGKVPIWAMATGIVYSAVAQFQRGLEMIFKLDEAMTDLRKVADESRQELKDFEADAVSIGEQMGITADKVVEATTAFARLGYTLKEASGLGETALLYSNVGDMNVDDASQALISTIKGFGVAEKDAVMESKKYADIFNEIGNNFAISSAGIGEALKRSSALLHQGGNTIEQAVALVTAANTTIQNPEVVGTALKTVAMALRGVDEEGNKVSHLVPELESHFNKFGSSIMKDASTFKSTYDIFDELAKHWSELTDVQKANITELIGGKRQGAIVSSMIENWTDATKSYEYALNSAGSAQLEFSRYQDGYAYKIGKLKGAVEEFWVHFWDDDTVKGAISGLTSLVQMFTKLNDTLGAFVPLSTVFLTFLTMANTGVRTFVMTGQGLTTLGALFTNLGGLVKNFGMILGRLTMVGLPIMLLTFVVEKLVGAYMKAKQSREEHLQSLRDEVQQTRQMVDAYKGFDINRYTQLTKMDKDSMGLAERKELIGLQEQLAGIMPDVIDYYDQEEKAVYKSGEQIKKLMKIKEKELLDKEVSLGKDEIDNFDYEKMEDASKHLKDITDDYNDYMKTDLGNSKIFKQFFETQLKDLDAGSKEMNDALYKMMDEMFEKNGQSARYRLLTGTENNFIKTGVGLGGKLLEALKDKDSTQADIQKAYDKYIKAINENNSRLANDIEDGKNVLADKGSELQNYMNSFAQNLMNRKGISTETNEGKFIQDFAENYSKGLAKVENDSDEFKEFFQNFNKNVQSVFDDINNKGINITSLYEGSGDIAQINSLEALADSYGKNSAKGEVLKAVIRDLIKEHKALADTMGDTKVASELDEQQLGELTQKYEDAVKNIAFLNQVLKELKDNHKLGADTMGELLDKYPDLIGAMGSEVEMSNAIKEALAKESKVAHESLSAKLMYNNEFYQKALKQNSSFFNNLQSAYGVDLSGFKNLAQAKSAVTEKLINSMGRGWAKFFEQTADGFADLNEAGLAWLSSDEGEMTGAKWNMYNTLTNINKELSNIKTGFDDITLSSINVSTDFSNVGLSDGKDKKDKEPAKPNWMDTWESWYREIQIWEQRNAKQEEAIQYQIELAKGEEDYATAISKSNDLIGERQKRISNLQWANNELSKWIGTFNQGWVDENGEATTAYLKAYNASTREQQEAMELQFTRLQTMKKQWLENADAITEEQKAITSLKEEIADLTTQKLQAEFDALIKKIDKTWAELERKVEDINRKFEFLPEDDTAGKMPIFKERLNALIEERSQIVKNIQELEAFNKTIEGQTELIEQNNEQIQNWKEELKNLNVEIVSGQNEVKDLYNQMADEIIQDYKDAIERQKEHEIKAIEDLEDAEKKRHDARMKNLDDEMSKFQESIQQQLDAIDKQENDANYESELGKKQEERQKILDQINKYSMDNTVEGRRKLADLKEQLSEKEEEIDKFMHDRQIELRKDSLNQQLEDKQDSIEKQKETEQKYSDSLTEEYEKRKEDLNKYYENILQDERKWNKIREDIMNENFDSIMSEMQDFIGKAISWSEELGDNLSKNVIENLKEMIELMKKLKGDSFKPSDLTPPASQDSTSNDGTSSSGSGGGSSNDSGDGSALKTKGLVLRKKDGGFEPPANGWDSSSIADLLMKNGYYGEFNDITNLYNSLGNINKFLGEYKGSKPQNVAILNLLKARGFRTGGYTGDWSGDSGKVAMLHKKELILNQSDTRNILDTVKVIRKFKDLHNIIRPVIQLPVMPKPDSVNERPINLNFNIERVEGGEQGAKTLVEKVADTLKRKGLK